MPVRTIRIELARPVDISWDELGVMLRTQRKVMAQLLRAGMDARIACGVVGTKATKKVVAKKAAGESPQTMAYQAMKLELKRIQSAKSWKPEARPALDIPGCMLSALSERVGQTYKLRPSFNSEQPIPIRKAETKIELDGNSVMLNIKLVSEGRTRIYARPSRGWHMDTLRRIAAGEYKHGDCRIVLDEDRRKWYALLAYDAPEQKPSANARGALVVHRGVHNAVTLMSTDGAVRYESGRKLFHQLRGLEQRMRDTRRIPVALLGVGARGHGKARRYEHYDALDGKRSRVVRTWCQQMAALVVRTAQERACSTILIENYGGQRQSDDAAVRRALIRFPMYQLKSAIQNAAQLKGIAVQEYAPEYISTTCPACGCQDERQHNYRTGTFHCAACALERPADFVAALNALRRSGADSRLWDERMAKVERLREAVADAAEE